MPTPTPPDACDVLDADHLAVKHLLVRYACLAYAPDSSESGEDRLAIARRICEELTVHAQVEEEIFYPTLRQAAPDAADVLEEARAEHDEAKALIAQIEALSEAGPELDQVVAALARAVEDHVKEERDELFPQARSAPGLDVMELAEQLRKRARQLRDLPDAADGAEAMTQGSDIASAQ